jgi:hypothetical protein
VSLSWTFAGSDAGGYRAAAVYTLIDLCDQRCRSDAWLADVLVRVRSPRQHNRRMAWLELEGDPTVKARRCCLGASRKTVAPAWGAGRMRTRSETFYLSAASLACRHVDGRDATARKRSGSGLIFLSDRAFNTLGIRGRTTMRSAGVPLLDEPQGGRLRQSPDGEFLPKPQD